MFAVVTASIAWPNFHPGDGTEVANQVAAPAETRTPNLHRATRSLIEECGWKGSDSCSSARKMTNKNQDNLLTLTGLLMEGDYTHNRVV